MKQELLAPAGNLEAGYAALYYGADAVYLGLRRFSARAGAENFAEDELDELTAYAHSLGRKVYVAINTVITENELPELKRSLDTCVRCRVDGIILQDLAVARILRESYSELEMHASTQMAVHNKEGALFLKSLGFKRVVVARELTLAEIKEIASIDGLETEAFIHGALCYSYSGLCQFSALETGRSANRGKCTYPCRACFKTHEGEKHLFSMKDMALGKDVSDLPVTSLKIEGRKKSPLYVAAVTDYYRRILDGFGDDPKRAENIKQIFSRPWCQFHFHGKNKNAVDQDFVGHRGLPLGTIESADLRKITLVLQHPLGRHDGLQIDVAGYEKPFGFSVQKMSVRGVSRFDANVGEKVEIGIPTGLPPLKKGMQVYLASSSAVKGAYPYDKPKKGSYQNTQPITVRVVVEPTKVTATAFDTSVSLSGTFEKATDVNNVRLSFEKSFFKTGGTPWGPVSLEVDNKQGLFVPASMMNELRRQLYAKVKPVEKEHTLPLISKPLRAYNRQWIIKTDQPSALKGLDLSDFSEITIVLAPTMRVSDFNFLPKNKVRLSLPSVCRQTQPFVKLIDYLVGAGYSKWQVANYWGLEVLPHHGIDLSFDAPLYVLNTEACEEARSIGARRITFATEDTLDNMKRLAESAPLETSVIVYQDAPLFTSAVCVRSNDCRHCDGKTIHTTISRGDRRYDVISGKCQTIVLDQAPICIAKEVKDLPVTCYQADFCHRPYTSEEICRILRQIRAFQNVSGSRQGNINHTDI